MSEDAHDIVEQWLPNNADAIKLNPSLLDTINKIPYYCPPKTQIISFDVDKFLRECVPFAPTFQDFLRLCIENETLMMGDEIRNALKALKKDS